MRYRLDFMVELNVPVAYELTPEDEADLRAWGMLGPDEEITELAVREYLEASAHPQAVYQELFTQGNGQLQLDGSTLMELQRVTRVDEQAGTTGNHS